MGYQEFAGRVRRRKSGMNEDSDWELDVDIEPNGEPEGWQ
jgi:hypothetical protein